MWESRVREGSLGLGGGLMVSEVLMSSRRC